MILSALALTGASSQQHSSGSVTLESRSHNVKINIAHGKSVSSGPVSDVSNIEILSNLTYSVTFFEYGLPTGTDWSVSISGHIWISNSTVIDVYLQSGQYNYLVNNSVSFFSPESIGTVNVSSDRVVNVYFYGNLAIERQLNIQNLNESSLNSSEDVFFVSAIYDGIMKSAVFASYSSESLIFLSATNYSTQHILYLGHHPNGLAVSGNGTLFVSTPGGLDVVYPNLNSIWVPLESSSIRGVGYGNGIVYVGSYTNGTYLINADRLNVQEHLININILSSQDIAYDVYNHFVYIASRNNTLTALNDTSVAGTWDMIFQPISLVPYDSGNIFYTMVPIHHSNTMISAYTLNLSNGHSLPVQGFGRAWAVAYDSYTHSIFFTDMANSTMNGLNTQVTSGVANISAPPDPYAIVYDPLTHSILSGGASYDVVDVYGFDRVPVVVNFTAIGLPHDLDFRVRFNGFTTYSTGPMASILLSPGVYGITIISPKGYTANFSSSIKVLGPTNFSVYFSKLQTLNFTEEGLPEGYNWTIQFNGELFHSYTSSIIIAVPNGTYQYYIPNVVNYSPTMARGNMTINSSATLDILFSTAHYHALFTSTDLPSGAEWSVSIGNIVFSTDSNNLSLNLTQGQYTFAIHDIPGFYPDVTEGNFSINASNTSIMIEWMPFTYSVTFNSRGLNNVEWGITIGNTTRETTADSIQFMLPNGTYTVRPFTSNGTYSSPIIGLKVSGISESINISFNPVFYSVKFVESGLPAGAVWYLNTSTGESSGPLPGDNYTMQLMNGTYSYNVQTSDREYAPAQSSGTFTVSGSEREIYINFNPVLYSVNLTEVGLPEHSVWYVNSSSGFSSGPIQNNYYILKLMNGSYKFSIGTSDKDYNTNKLSVTVNGSSMSETVNFNPVLFSVSFVVSGLPGNTPWFIVSPNGSIYHTDMSDINVKLINGTYLFKYGTVNRDFKGGSIQITVSGKNLTEELNFTQVRFKVVFLVNNTEDIHGFSLYIPEVGNYSTSGESLTLYLMNGTYSYLSSPSNKSWKPAGGSFNVSGSSLIIHLCYLPVLYSLTISIRNNITTSWTLQIGGNVLYISEKSITLYLQNGSYQFQIIVPGYETYNSTIHIAGKDVSLGLHLSPVTYKVLFKAKGLDKHQIWYLNISGLGNFSSASSVIIIRMAEGNYHYFASTSPTYGNISGNLNVNGKERVILDFKKVEFRVVFTEHGLKNHTTWTTWVKGVGNFTSNDRSFTVYLHDGYYIFTVENVNGYKSIYNGSFHVDGRNINIGIRFHKSEAVYYNVSVQVLGPSPGLMVYVNGILLTGNSFELANGTYNITVYVGGPTLSLLNGNLEISGQPITVLIINSPMDIFILEFNGTVFLPPLPGPIPPPSGVNQFPCLNRPSPFPAIPISRNLPVTKPFPGMIPPGISQKFQINAPQVN